MTARGKTFANLEDETSLVNILISRGCWQCFRSIARSPGLLIRGQFQRADGVINVIADNLATTHLPTDAFHTGRDFR
jgi:error-prone DNA polymerase